MRNLMRTCISATNATLRQMKTSTYIQLHVKNNRFNHIFSDSGDPPTATPAILAVLVQLAALFLCHIT